MQVTTSLYYQSTGVNQPKLLVQGDIDFRKAPDCILDLSRDPPNNLNGTFIIESTVDLPEARTISVSFPTTERLKDIEHAEIDLYQLDALPDLGIPFASFYRRPLAALRERIVYAIVTNGAPHTLSHPEVAKAKPETVLFKRPITVIETMLGPLELPLTESEISRRTR